jgi:hypothetical protein
MTTYTEPTITELTKANVKATRQIITLKQKIIQLQKAGEAMYMILANDVEWEKGGELEVADAALAAWEDATWENSNG